MIDKFELNLTEQDLGRRVRAILGVPDSFLTDDVISSPTFIIKSENFINKNIKEYLELIQEEFELDLLKVSAVYYICYLLCIGMDARLPKQMENLSTKTVLQTISWDEKALEMIEKANESLEDFLEEYDIEEDTYSTTIADLSDETSYPESNI